MRYTQLLILLCLLTISGFTKGEDDLATLEGTWKPTSARRGVQNHGDHILQQMTWTIRDGSYFVQDRRDRMARVRITLDPTKAPKEIDAIVTEGESRGAHDRGVYELDGDILKVCWGLGSTRPTRVEWQARDPTLYLIIYERVK